MRLWTTPARETAVHDTRQRSRAPLLWGSGANGHDAAGAAARIRAEAEIPQTPRARDPEIPRPRDPEAPRPRARKNTYRGKSTDFAGSKSDLASSSTLTSLNVTTRTFLTNRAGR